MTLMRETDAGGDLRERGSRSNELSRMMQAYTDDILVRTDADRSSEKPPEMRPAKPGNIGKHVYTELLRKMSPNEIINSKNSITRQQASNGAGFGWRVKRHQVVYQFVHKAVPRRVISNAGFVSHLANERQQRRITTSKSRLNVAAAVLQALISKRQASNRKAYNDLVHAGIEAGTPTRASGDNCEITGSADMIEFSDANLTVCRPRSSRIDHQKMLFGNSVKSGTTLVKRPEEMRVIDPGALDSCLQLDCRRPGNRKHGLAHGIDISSLYLIQYSQDYFPSKERFNLRNSNRPVFPALPWSKQAPVAGRHRLSGTERLAVLITHQPASVTGSETRSQLCPRGAADSSSKPVHPKLDQRH
jgi:hypothetical protein